MYIAMNRFQIARGREEEFEGIWKNRDSHLEGVSGFQSFRLLKGAAGADATTYVSHSMWDSEDAFVGWTKSDNFRKAHADARPPAGMHKGPPRFEGFSVVLEK